jgi:methanethiol S-methyltransferase
MVLLVFLWAIFYILHSLLASLEVKALVKNKWPGFYKFYRIGFNVFAVISFGLIWLYQRSMADDLLFIIPTWVKTSGYILMASGLILVIAALSKYDLSEFSGTKQLKSKPAEADRAGGLVTSGFNGIVRHPLYFSTVILLSGFLLQSFTLANVIFISVSLLYLYIGAKLEEKKLEKVFGEEYKQYKKRVKMLIPFVF